MRSLDQEVLSLMRSVTQRAILPRFRNLQSGDIQDKGGNDPVTVADREAEAMLREGLEALNSGIDFVGEEAAHEDKSTLSQLSSACWIVDPLDGTRNFAQGKAPFGILIAMADAGEVQSGWIFDCLSGRFCAAHLGAGAFINAEPVMSCGSGEEMPVAAISLLFMDEAKRERTRQNLIPYYRIVDIPWCAAEQYPRLALGENDLSLFERTLPWDHAAGILWLNEAGGKAARPDGSPYRVDQWARPGLIGASTPAIWEDAAERLAAPG